jgi:hydrogenase maturation protease
MIRIIGVGSPFGADQLGWLAIDHLVACSLPNCELMKLDRPGIGLLDHFQNVDQVILIDALLSQEATGRVVLIQADELVDCESLTSSHGFGVAETVAMAAQLGALPARLHLIGILVGDDLSLIPSMDTSALEKQVHSLL